MLAEHPFRCSGSLAARSALSGAGQGHNATDRAVCPIEPVDGRQAVAGKDGEMWPEYGRTRACSRFGVTSPSLADIRAFDSSGIKLVRSPIRIDGLARPCLAPSKRADRSASRPGRARSSSARSALAVHASHNTHVRQEPLCHVVLRLPMPARSASPGAVTSRSFVEPRRFYRQIILGIGGILPRKARESRPPDGSGITAPSSVAHWQGAAPMCLRWPRPGLNCARHVQGPFSWQGIAWKANAGRSSAARKSGPMR